MKFSDRIHNLRIEKGYTLQDLANRLGTSYQTIQKYEKGISKPRLARLEELAKLFDVSISYLLGETDIRTSSTLNHTFVFSDRIKILRLEAGYSQKELAKMIGVSQGNYAKYGTEIGHIIPTIDRLKKLAEIFNVSVSYLLGETDERTFIEKAEPSSFPERLKLLRVESGYTQAEISKKLNLSSRQVYNNYEKGVNKPQKETLEKLADFFEVSVEYLLNGTHKLKSSKPK